MFISDGLNSYDELEYITNAIETTDVLVEIDIILVYSIEVFEDMVGFSFHHLLGFLKHDRKNLYSIKEKLDSMTSVRECEIQIVVAALLYGKAIGQKIDLIYENSTQLVTSIISSKHLN